MIKYTSANPITVTQNNVSVVYDTWVVSYASTAVNSDWTIPLTIQFSLANIDANGNVHMLPGQMMQMNVKDIATDATLGTPGAALFSAIISEAVSTGVIS